MRPDRIGAIPIVLADHNDLNVSPTQSNIVFSGTFLGRGASVGPTNVSLASPITGFYGEVAYLTWELSSNYTITGTTAGVGTGIFMLPTGLSGLDDSLPIFLRLAMSASIGVDFGSPSLDSGQDTERPPLMIVPVLGIRNPDTSVNTNAPNNGNDGRLLQWATVPASVYSYVDGHASDNIYPYMYCAVNDTFFLAKQFGRFSGTGLGPAAELGVGFFIRRQEVRRDVVILARSQFMVSAWIYTGDIDCYDPQRS